MREEISEGLKTALKARDQRRTATLRAIMAAVKDRDIAVRTENRGLIGDAEIVTLIQKMVKQREESLAIYTQAGRQDLASVEKEEIDILNEFLPQALSEAEVDEGHQGGDRQDRRGGRQGHGQGDRQPQGRLPGPHRFRQGGRKGEGGPWRLRRRAASGRGEDLARFGRDGEVRTGLVVDAQRMAVASGREGGDVDLLGVLFLVRVELDLVDAQRPQPPVTNRVDGGDHPRRSGRVRRRGRRNRPRSGRPRW